jgi:hypothetical protein
MTGLLLCTCFGTCQADRTCQLPSRFQARLDTAPHAPSPRVCRRTEACASHFGAMIAAITNWAREHDLSGGDLTIFAIDPPPGASTPGQPPRHGTALAPGLAFSTIPLESLPPRAAGRGHAEPLTDTARPAALDAQAGSGSDLPPGLMPLPARGRRYK